MARTFANPRNWSEMSTDFKAMFGFHVPMMLVWVIAGTGALTLQAEIGIASVLLAIAASISIWRKRASGWRWPGVGLKEVAQAFLVVVAITVFLFATTPLAPPLNPRMLPWYLMGGGIGLFNVLQSLTLVTTSEEEFQAQCGEPPPPNTAAQSTTEHSWKRIVQWAFSTAFVAVWLEGVAFFYFFGVGVRDGTHEPTAQNTETLFNHGEVVYVTANTKHFIDVLQTTMAIGIPSILLLGAFLQFGLKIPILHIRGTDRG